jgi:hypothetical protein
MRPLRATAIAVPAICYAFFAVAHYRRLPVAAHWWGASAFATAAGFVLFGFSQRPEYGGDGGAGETEILQTWLPRLVAPLMLCVGCWFVWWSLTSPFGDPWGALAGACIAVVGGALVVNVLRPSKARRA